MKILNRLFVAVIAIALLGSCKKDKVTSLTNNNNIKTAKFTITVTGITSSQDIATVVFGAAVTNGAKTLWKVNGQTADNETTIALTNSDFMGATKTYVVELLQPALSADVDVQILDEETANLSVSYKAEINGKVVKDDENVAVVRGTDGYTHDYSY